MDNSQTKLEKYQWCTGNDFRGTPKFPGTPEILSYINCGICSVPHMFSSREIVMYANRNDLILWVTQWHYNGYFVFSWFGS